MRLVNVLQDFSECRVIVRGEVIRSVISQENAQGVVVIHIHPRDGNLHCTRLHGGLVPVVTRENEARAFLGDSCAVAAVSGAALVNGSRVALPWGPGVRTYGIDGR